MLRRSLSGLSLVALLATGAAAQLPFQETFQFTGTAVTGFNNYSGEFYDAGGFNNIGQTGELPNQFFEIWCVDPMEYVNYGQVSVAYVTPLASGAANMGNTLSEYDQTGPDHGNGDVTIHHVGVDGATSLTDYEDAAYLASKMTAANADTYENAIWTVMGYSGHDTPGAALAIAGINLNDPTFDFRDWAVISSGTSEQEFIYHRDDGGHFLEVTPEPATMAMMAIGLVGMAGTSMRRRKKQSV